MGANRGYDIFPRTWLPRALLGLAFAGGLAAIVGYFVVLFAFLSPFEFPPCPGTSSIEWR